MEAALRIKTKVLPGSKIEISDPDLVVGEAVDVIVVVPGKGKRRRALKDILQSSTLPQRKTTAEEVDRRIQEERDSWDR